VASRRYSNLAIVTALTLRIVFRLPLRQTEGFLDSLLRLMELDLKAPDHTTLSRRNQEVDVPAPTKVHDGPIHLIVDSTGLKISDAGEWHAHRRKSSKARGQWRKLHVGVDDDGFIVAAKLTKSSEDDPSTVPDLLEQVDSPIKRFTADGAYDTRSVYELLGEVGAADIKIMIPPRRGAVPSEGAEGTWAQRNATLETIRKVGRQGWQRESCYRPQGAVENIFVRYKRTLGDSLRTRDYESQKREARIACNVLNRTAELGKPESQAIVGGVSSAAKRSRARPQLIHAPTLCNMLDSKEGSTFNSNRISARVAHHPPRTPTRRRGATYRGCYRHVSGAASRSAAAARPPAQSLHRLRASVSPSSSRFAIRPRYRC